MIRAQFVQMDGAYFLDRGQVCPFVEYEFCKYVSASLNQGCLSLYYTKCMAVPDVAPPACGFQHCLCSWLL